LLSLGVGTAAAAETGSIGGNMVDEAEAPIGGVEFNMTGPNEYDESTESDDQGNWAFEITEPGQYFVTINPDSLPSGVGLTEPDKVTRSVVVFKLETAPPPVRFLTGPGPERASTFDRAMQLTIDGLLLGVTIGLAAVGLSLIFGTTGLTNFAHGELLTLGGMMTYFFNKMGLHVIPSALIALVIAIVVGGFLQDRYLWKPLRKRGTGLIAMLVISIGFGLLARYVFLYLFGGDKQQFLQYAGQPGWQLGPISITPKATASALIGIVLIGLTIAWLLKSQLGKASRAVADNPALAASSGIDVERVIMVVWILGAFLAGYGGIMMGLNQGVQWIMGSDVLLLIFAAVTLGGLGTAYGAIVGSLIVGLFIQLSTLIIPTELKYVGALVVLILILLVRPQGIMGRRERIG
ncbi:MAG: branched-chain amino acid ABC transporter permease, partial [Candidatus Nanopelagicales bacterium]